MKNQTLQELEDLRDLANSTNDPEQLREMLKSVTSIAADAVTGAAQKAKGKTVDGDGEGNGDEDDINAGGEPGEANNADPDNGSDNGDGEGNGDDVVPVGRQMKKSLGQAMREANLPEHGDGIDAMPVIESLSEGLMENNKQGHQNFNMLKSINSMLGEFRTEIFQAIDEVKEELATQRPMVKSTASFVESVRQTPAGTPRSESGVPVQSDALFNKSLGGATPEDLKNEPQTLRGLNTNQLVKGLQSRLSKDESEDNKHYGLSLQDLMKIGEVPISQLNPKIAEVAAEELGVALTD